MTIPPFFDITRRGLHTYNISSALPPELEVGLLGQYRGKTAYLINVLGSRSAGWLNTTVLGDTCEYLDTSQALMNTPTTSTPLYLVSTAAGDNASGAGAQVARIEYLDAAGALQSVTYNLNGTTPVSIGTGYAFIELMEIDRHGTSETSLGDVSITSTNGAATVATTFERVNAGGNRSLSGRFKVPAGYSAYIINWSCAAISTTMDCRIRVTARAIGRAISTVYHFEDKVFLASGDNFDHNLHYVKCPAGSIIKISAIPGGAPAGNKLDASFHLLLVAD